MHAEGHLTGREPSGIEYVQQHEHGHDFDTVSIRSVHIVGSVSVAILFNVILMGIKKFHGHV